MAKKKSVALSKKLIKRIDDQVKKHPELKETAKKAKKRIRKQKRVYHWVLIPIAYFAYRIVFEEDAKGRLKNWIENLKKRFDRAKEEKKADSPN